MPVFKKPGFSFTFDEAGERKNLRDYRDTKPGRAIPKPSHQSLLIASWNIANLGAQKREPPHYALIAEVISWFDVVAIQEVRDDLAGLRGILAQLPGSWRAIFSDMAGNDERMAWLYRSTKVKPLEMWGEVGIPVSDHPKIALPGVGLAFEGFDRNPMIATFDVGGFRLGAVNVHLYFGKQDTAADQKQSMERRQLEAYAVSRWCDLRRKDADRYVDHFLALGDFNLPKWEDDDPIRKALTKRGLRQPTHSSKIASAIASDSDYDQILAVPGLVGRIKQTGVFDYDGGIFPSLFQSKTKTQFNAYLRYYISDHRPIWSEIDIT